MEVRLLYFAVVRERLNGLESETLSLQEGCTVGSMWESLAERHPALGPLRPHLRVAVNNEFAKAETVLKAGDTVALIPPVSGGSGRCWISKDALDVRQVEAVVTRDQAGAIVTFQGVVRDHTGDRQVAHLEYEIYPEMAVAQLNAICDEVETRWPRCKAAIAHRYGKLAIGEASVVIAVSSPHRPEAFEGCRHAIERIKEEVPIWKKEVGPDGESWVGFGS